MAIENYNRGSRDLPPLAVGDSIRVQNHKVGQNWSHHLCSKW